MSTKKALIVSAVTGLFAVQQLPVSGQSEPAPTPSFKSEKCYGIARAGKNDCAANGHACQAQARTDGDGNEWIYVPAGTCERFVAGSLAPKRGR